MAHGAQKVHVQETILVVVPDTVGFVKMVLQAVQMTAIMLVNLKSAVMENGELKVHVQATILVVVPDTAVTVVMEIKNAKILTMLKYVNLVNGRIIHALSHHHMVHRLVLVQDTHNTTALI